MCCDHPCLVPMWIGNKYGVLCTNCQTFTES